MSSVADKGAPPPLRSRLMRAAAWLRMRPWRVFLGGLVIDLALLVPAHLGDWHEAYVGVPAAIASLVVVTGALVGGPVVGTGLAIATGIAFDALVVTDRWLLGGVASAIVIVVWLFAAVAAGMLGDRYRGQVTASLEQAADARRAVERVLEVTPSFHASGGLTGVARAVCLAAIEATGCAAAALVTIEDDELRLLAREPGGWTRSSEPLALDALPDVKAQLVSQLKPSFLPDVARHRGRTVLVDLAGFTGIASALRVPVVLDDRAVAVLALGWEAETAEPDAGWVATMQRFADHAAVALEKERRVEAERDAARLYRRFEASLIPHIGRSASDLRVGVSYSPGERRMRLGGDFVDLVTGEDGTVRAVIGDVAGHGPDAAAVGAHLRAAWRALAHHDLDAAAAMATLNHLILEESDRAEAEKGRMPVMATMYAVELPPDRSAVTVVSAGHPPALLMVRGEVTTLPLGGLPLGVEPCQWMPVTTPLPEAWVLLLYTDGIIEAREAPGSQARIGIAGLAALLGAAASKESPTGADLRGLTGSVERMNGGALSDDATLLALSRVGSAQGAHLT